MKGNVLNSPQIASCDFCERQPQRTQSIENVGSKTKLNLNSIVVIALGSNVAGCWGTPRQTLQRAIRALSRRFGDPVAVASLYKTPPVGQVRQPVFLNTTVIFSVNLLPRPLVILAKSLERQAGRNLGVLNGPRPLDIDIVDYGGWRINQPARSTRCGRRPLMLPHPEVCNRGFVLVPLAEIWPNWRHPVTGVKACDCLRRRPWLWRGVQRVVDSDWYLCDTQS